MFKVFTIIDILDALNQCLNGGECFLLLMTKS